MKNKYLYPFLGSFVCLSQAKRVRTSPFISNLNVVKLNLEKGYTLNQFTGDTIKIGVHYSGKGKVIPLSEKANVVTIATNKLIRNKVHFYTRKEKKES